MLTVEQVLTVIAGLVGAPALLALLINVLKWAGVVTDGTAGKWSAAFNLIVLIVVAAVLQFYPKINIPNVDQALLELVKFAALIFEYIIQITVTKATHLAYQKAVVYRMRPTRG